MRLKDWNRAAIMKQIWTLLTNPNSQWTEWVKYHLLKGKSLWQVRMPYNPSWSWRKILQARDQCRHLFTVKIGNGNTTSLWFDYWLQGGQRPYDLLTPRQLASTGLHWNAKVSAILEGDDWRFPEGNHLLRTVWDGVPIRPPNHNTEDQVIWQPNPRGVFTIQTAWEYIRVHHPPDPTHLLLWQRGHIPRHSFILWLAINNKLRTMDRIPVSMGLPSHACVLCNQGAEDHDHLFFQCSYTRGVWDDLQAKAGITWPSLSWTLCIQWATTNYHHKHNASCKVARIMLAATVYFIWQERNRRIFSNQFKSRPCIVQEIVQLIRTHLSCMGTLPDSIVTRWDL